MKRFFTLSICLAFYGFAMAQTDQKIFKPLREEVYYWEVAKGWVRYHTYVNSYNVKGDRLTRITYNSDMIPVSKDSIVYIDKSVLLEKYNLIWDINSDQFINKDKIVNCYNSDGTSCGSLVYTWTNNNWRFISGSEIVTSDNSQLRQKTITTRTFAETEGIWKNVEKQVITYADNGDKISELLYSADSQSGDFVFFSNMIYTGWHNNEKGIYKQRTIEKYVNGAWIQESLNTIVKKENFWEETELRITEDSARYRIIFNDDQSFRGVYKSNAGGWMMLSEYEKAAGRETLVQNSIEGDVVKSIYTKVREFNNSERPIRQTELTTGKSGDTLNYSDVIHELEHDQDANLVSDIQHVRFSGWEEYVPAIKRVYADYIDVTQVTSLRPDGKSHNLNIYPNPAEGIIKVEKAEKNAAFVVRNVAGEVKWSGNLENNYTDLSELNSGIYFFEFISEEKLYRERIFIR